MTFLTPPPKTPPPPPDQAEASRMRDTTSQTRMSRASTLLTGDNGLPNLGATRTPTAGGG